MTTTPILLTESDRGPAERLLEVILGSSAHLWHNRPGIDDGGVWKPAPQARARAAAPPPSRACSCRRRWTCTASCWTSTS